MVDSVGAVVVVAGGHECTKVLPGMISALVTGGEDIGYLYSHHLTIARVEAMSWFAASQILYWPHPARSFIFRPVNDPRGEDVKQVSFSPSNAMAFTAPVASFLKSGLSSARRREERLDARRQGRHHRGTLVPCHA